MKAPDWNIMQWSKMFNSIYGHSNKLRSPEHLCSRVIEETAELIDPVIHQKPNKVKYELPDIFAWLLALCTATDVNLHLCVFEKFKQGCPSCGEFMDCMEADVLNGLDVQPPHKDPKKVLSYNQHKEPTNLDEWQEIFDKIYGKKNKNNAPYFLLTRLTEDVGLLSKMLRQKAKKKDLEWKIASIFAWIMALCNRYSATTERGEYPLSDIVGEKYANICYKCKENPCICIELKKFYISGHRGSFGEFKTIKPLMESNDYTAVWTDPENGKFPILDAITKIKHSDAAIIIISEKFDPWMYAEITAILKDLQDRLIFCYVKDGVTSDNKEICNFVEILERILSVTNYRSNQDLSIKFSRLMQDIKGQYRFS